MDPWVVNSHTEKIMKLFHCSLQLRRRRLIALETSFPDAQETSNATFASLGT
jgi:hypothetical protein